MEEKKGLNEEALIAKQDRKKYIRTVIITTVAVLLTAVGIVVFITSAAKASTKDDPKPVIMETQETEEVIESTAAPEIDIPTEPTVGESVESTKPSVPSIEETKPNNNNSNSVESTNPSVPENTPSEAPVAPERGDYPIDPPQTDRERLACVIYQEVGGNMHCDECRKRVGDVVLNRVNDPRFPNTIEGVLLQSGQYGKLSWTGIVWQSRAQYASEKAAVERAYRIADELLAGNHSSLYGNGYVWQAGFVQGRDNIYCCGHYFGR